MLDLIAFEERILIEPHARCIYADGVRESGVDEFADILRGPYGNVAVWLWQRSLHRSLRECAFFAGNTSPSRTPLALVAAG